MAEALERRCRLCGAIVSAASTFCSRCGAAAEDVGGNDDELAEQIRALFTGEIAVDREIGRGSMAVVYAGFDLELERRVAIKALLPDVALDPEFADRFKREAKMVAALNHPNVIPIYSFRNSQTLSAITMQFVDGNSLDVVLRQRGSSMLPLPLAGLILSQVAAGLEHAHSRGVVHRDVKPANVLLDPGGQAIVSDFGIARRDGLRATASGVLLGTAAYMSPEQCLGRRADAASDQYALGVMAFELLAGRRPFIGRSTELLAAHIQQAPPPLSQFRPDLSPDIESFVMRMLAKGPAARHASLRDAERFFRRLVPDEASATTQLMQASLRKPLEAPAPRDAVAEPAPVIAIGSDQASRPMRRRWGLLAAGAGAAALLISGAMLVRRAPQTGVQAAKSFPELPQSSTGARQSPAASAEVSTAKTTEKPGRHVAGAATTVPAQHDTTPSPAIGPGALVKPATDTSGRPDTASNSPRPQGEVQSKASIEPTPATPSVVATAADARMVANEFLTLCNHRQWEDIDRLSSLDGSADLRKELIERIRRASDFQAGFDRLASRPVLAGRAFTTEFVLDLEWRGGQRQLHVTVSAELANGSWHLAGFGVQAPD